uniref:Uncharacterized protein n=1 Tax=Tetranychus urticae TaxID=32264 RepID=T1K4W0_TETUR
MLHLLQAHQEAFFTICNVTLPKVIWFVKRILKNKRINLVSTIKQYNKKHKLSIFTFDLWPSFLQIPFALVEPGLLI